MATPLIIGGYQASRHNLFEIDPRAIKVDWSKNVSRRGQEPPVDDELKQLAHDMMSKKYDAADDEAMTGQLNPVFLRKNGDEYQLMLGYRRLKAGLWLIESGTCPDFRIFYRTTKMTDAEAALANMSENMHRLDPEPIQTAHAIRHVMDEYGFSLKEVAARFKQSPTWCSKLLELIDLPQAIQDAVEAKEMPITAALEVAKLDGNEAQQQAFNEMRDEGGKITAKRAREKSESKGDGEKKAKGPLAKLRKFLEGQSKANNGSSSLADVLIEWLDGEQDDEAMFKYWDATFEFANREYAAASSN